MADQLTREWEKLKLTDEEEATVVGIGDDLDNGLQHPRIALSLIGKLLTNKPYNVDAMKRVMKNLWRLTENVAIRAIETNLYIFQFFCDEDKQKVLDGRPWAFDNHMLLMQEIKGDEQPSAVVFKDTPFWIRLMDVPFGMRNASFAKEIGDSMGGFLEFDDSDPLGWDVAMRIKVLLDVDKPLRRGIKVASGYNVAKWIGIKYERLGDFCYFCGRLGHADKECQEQDKIDDESAMVFQYGPFLVASPNQRNRVDMNEREKERKWMKNLTQSNTSRRVTYNDPDAIRVGPPGAARKLFATPQKHSNPSPPKARETRLVAVVDPVSNKLVLRPSHVSVEPMQGVEENATAFDNTVEEHRAENMSMNVDTEVVNSSALASNEKIGRI